MGKRRRRQYCKQTEASRVIWADLFGFPRERMCFLHVRETKQYGYGWLARPMDNGRALHESKKKTKKNPENITSFWFGIKGLKARVNKLLMVYGETD